MRRALIVGALLSALGCQESTAPPRLEQPSLDLIDDPCNPYINPTCAKDLRDADPLEFSILQGMLWDLSNHWDTECQQIAQTLGGKLSAGEFKVWDNIYFKSDGSFALGDYHLELTDFWYGEVHLWSPLARDSDGLRDTFIHEGAHATFLAGHGLVSQYGTAEYFADHCKSQWV